MGMEFLSFRILLKMKILRGTFKIVLKIQSIQNKNLYFLKKKICVEQPEGLRFHEIFQKFIPLDFLIKDIKFTKKILLFGRKKDYWTLRRRIFVSI